MEKRETMEEGRAEEKTEKQGKGRMGRKIKRRNDGKLYRLSLPFRVFLPSRD